MLLMKNMITNQRVADLCNKALELSRAHVVRVGLELFVRRLMHFATQFPTANEASGV